MTKTKSVASWLTGFYLLALMAPSLSFGQAEGGAMAQLKQAVVTQHSAAVDAGNTVTVQALPGGPLTGEMCIRKKPGIHLSQAQLKKIRARADALIKKLNLEKKKRDAVRKSLESKSAKISGPSAATL
jgi:hypothetical protein